MCDGHNHTCHHQDVAPSVRQNLDEMDFERGLWGSAVNNDEESITKLLSKGTDPSCTDNYGFTPLHYAARKGNLTIVKKLVEAGALVNALTNNGKVTPLHRAASQGHDKIVSYLILKGANPLQVDVDGETALHKAVIEKRSSVVKLLLEKTPQLKTIKNKKGNTACDLVNDNTPQDIKNLLK